MGRAGPIIIHTSAPLSYMYVPCYFLFSNSVCERSQIIFILTIICITTCEFNLSQLKATTSTMTKKCVIALKCENQKVSNGVQVLNSNLTKNKQYPTFSNHIWELGVGDIKSLAAVHSPSLKFLPTPNSLFYSIRLIIFCHPLFRRKDVKLHKSFSIRWQREEVCIHNASC